MRGTRGRDPHTRPTVQRSHPPLLCAVPSSIGVADEEAMLNGSRSAVERQRLLRADSRHRGDIILFLVLTMVYVSSAFHRSVLCWLHTLRQGGEWAEPCPSTRSQMLLRAPNLWSPGTVLATASSRASFVCCSAGCCSAPNSSRVATGIRPSWACIVAQCSTCLPSVRSEHGAALKLHQLGYQHAS